MWCSGTEELHHGCRASNSVILSCPFGRKSLRGVCPAFCLTCVCAGRRAGSNPTDGPNAVGCVLLVLSMSCVFMHISELCTAVSHLRPSLLCSSSSHTSSVSSHSLFSLSRQVTLTDGNQTVVDPIRQTPLLSPPPPPATPPPQAT